MQAPSDQRNLYAAERTILAAERTLLAWNRTSLALMGFGFVIERFGLYIQMLETVGPKERMSSFWIGLSFIILGSIIAFMSVFRYRKILNSIDLAGIPKGYSVATSIAVNVLLGLLGLLLTLFLVISFFEGI